MVNIIHSYLARTIVYFRLPINTNNMSKQIDRLWYNKENESLYFNSIKHLRGYFLC